MLTDDDLRKLRHNVRTDLMPKMKSSRFALFCFDESGPDPMMLMQIGAAIMLEKPLVVLVTPGALVPPLLRQIAAAVIETDERQPKMSQAALEKAVGDILAKEPKRQ